MLIPFAVPSQVSVGKSSDRRLELVVWQLAWDRYALAAAALGQLPWCAALQHKADVLETGLTAHVESRGPILGVLYDEVCRSAHCLKFALCSCGMS